MIALAAIGGIAWAAVEMIRRIWRWAAPPSDEIFPFITSIRVEVEGGRGRH